MSKVIKELKIELEDLRDTHRRMADNLGVSPNFLLTNYYKFANKALKELDRLNQTEKKSNRYAIAVCHFEQDNQVKIVEAANQLEAMVEAVGDHELWGIVNGNIPFDTVSEGITFYLQGDVQVSEPIKL